MTAALDGKVVIITGAGRGLGRAMTLGLLEAGARVAESRSIRLRSVNCARRRKIAAPKIASSTCRRCDPRHCRAENRSRHD